MLLCCRAKALTHNAVLGSTPINTQRDLYLRRTFATATSYLHTHNFTDERRFVTHVTRVSASNRREAKRPLKRLLDELSDACV